MSTVYEGNPANITTPLSATIIGATGNLVSPIVLQTNAAHLFQTGDQVNVSAVLGNTAANNSPNNPWIITVVDATHFSLNGSTGNGAYVSGGTATDWSLTPAFTIPSDGDAPTAASVNVALQMLADRTEYIITRVKKATQTIVGLRGGSATLINTYISQTTDDTWASWSNTTPANGSWGTLQNANNIFGTTTFGGAANFVAPVPTCQAFDFFDLNVTVTALTGSGNDIAVGLGINLNGGGTNQIAGLAHYLLASSTRRTLNLRTQYLTGNIAGQQTFDFGIMGYGISAATANVQFVGYRSAILHHYRAFF